MTASASSTRSHIRLSVCLVAASIPEKAASRPRSRGTSPSRTAQPSRSSQRPSATDPCRQRGVEVLDEARLHIGTGREVAIGVGKHGRGRAPIPSRRRPTVRGTRGRLAAEGPAVPPARRWRGGRPSADPARGSRQRREVLAALGDQPDGEFAVGDGEHLHGPRGGHADPDGEVAQQVVLVVDGALPSAVAVLAPFALREAPLGDGPLLGGAERQRPDVGAVGARPTEFAEDGEAAAWSAVSLVIAGRRR